MLTCKSEGGKLDLYFNGKRVPEPLRPLLWQRFEYQLLSEITK